MKDENTLKAQEVAVSVDPQATPILYTDNITITANEYGFVFDILQRLGPTNQAKVVSRIGMSREHVKKFIQEISKLLITTEGNNQEINLLGLKSRASS